MVFPHSKEEFKNLAAQANLIPVYSELSSALETPLSAFIKLKKESYAFLLESVEGGQQLGRYSFIGVEPSILFQAKDGKVAITEEGETVQYDSVDPLKELEKIFNRYTTLNIPSLPAFSGGAVGYFGYDMIRYWEKLPKPVGKNTEYPDCFLMFANTVIIFDHVKQTMKIVVNTKVGDNPEKDYERAVLRIKEISSILSKQLTRVTLEEQNMQNMKSCADYEHNCTSDEFQEMVRRAKEYIIAGDIFQVVLSQKIKLKLETDPLAIYSSLRCLNPSPYMFYLSFDDINLIGSSPEIMVKVVDGIAKVKPIAGTRPRGETLEDDKQLADELLADEKEKAEHLMLVDLGRNDLGRVCEYGTIKVKDFMCIENYSHVMHIVSDVTGTLKKGYTCFDILRASFPAGTVSGAPKIRAMEIIDELETDGRGPYAGAVGYISYTGNMDTCITIRTLIAKKDRGFIQAGAGIVADSNPLMEYHEACNKAQALLTAVEIAKGGELLAVSNR
ncbi:MAG: anthranilate synthase [Desulfitibacter sp. BRH_c19]|nr:MAG: anthranilate synthase [Desulfitibacter sp. BRH_c19]